MKALWLCLCLGLAACADTGARTWYRVDGSPHPPGQLESDKVACEQEMRKPQATQAAGLDRDIVQANLYEKCMTRLGYTDSKLRPAPAPPGAAAPGAVAGAPPGATPATAAAPSAECRKVSDLRMWLPLCP